MIILGAIVILWLGLCLVVVAVCVAAGRGDEGDAVSPAVAHGRQPDWRMASVGRTVARSPH